VRTDLPKKLAAYHEPDLPDRFPERCPYTLEQVLGDFWPPTSDGGSPYS
jgi:hypothetical protein